MRAAAAIVAAGRGQRAGGGLPKQYRALAGKPVARWSLDRFAAHSRVVRQVAAIHPDDEDLFTQTAQGLAVDLTYGGETRTASVRACLEALAAKDPPDAVLIHDAARPLVTDDLIDRLLSALAEADGAAPAIPIPDAIKRADGENWVTEDVSRHGLFRVQTPQTFRFEPLLEIYRALPDDAAFDDDVAAARAAGLNVQIVDGGKDNIKITFPGDFDLASRLLTGQAERAPAAQRDLTTGTGFDVHRLAPGDGVWLCGVHIPCDLRLVGHSDADAGLHALTDAILGAAALGDIGDHFPPSDMRWKDAASDQFLLHAKALVAQKGGRVIHGDVTVICERPKIKPHREAMRARLAQLLDLPLDRVSVKATTTEGLGFPGRREGVAAQAVASVAWS